MKQTFCAAVLNSNYPDAQMPSFNNYPDAQMPSFNNYPDAHMPSFHLLPMETSNYAYMIIFYMHVYFQFIVLHFVSLRK